ncbi:SAM hydrolase/SAM-dependent halogenase family protein [Halalkalicoccus jeotgali]|uniref:NAD operon protein n=1 Tax=Halalkalicoccus jeotgali (strain DSM 18796 / CECT 7217 / JCM 14584 / KCTC 4019 / B3) TaxID=795797 RepID=D8J8I9_HALJB|nr:SAM-dependent chlorinase/fluorinase [Halalkalicoccus jeotgali]ADJ16235.1 NAD operon protein [Halalkalicoccus jeotgali B3]ELY37310.1 NAD operon protein [Halalkalicoccus jeotgali B3]
MITLASDFGEPYPAAMKGVLLSRTDAQLVDVAHNLPRQEPRTAAFWLRETLPWFPPAVHLAVIDPGVGTDRAALVVRAGESALVGPDNGVLMPAARELGEPEVFAIDPHHGEFPATGGEGSTFDGRDVFAPAVAAVHETGVDELEGLGWLSALDDPEELRFPEPDLRGREASGEVLVTDRFGNAITNIPGSLLEDRFGDEVAVNGTAVPAERSYAGVEPGHRLVTVGSHGNVELAVNVGRGDDAFGVGVGSDVTISF